MSSSDLEGRKQIEQKEEPLGGFKEFEWPSEPPKPPVSPCVRHILEEGVDSHYELSQHQWLKVQQQKGFKEHPRGRLCDLDSTSQTLTSNYRQGYLYSQFVQLNPWEIPRFFTPRECCRLMGFPETFNTRGCSNEGQFYRQIGNAVSPPVVKLIIEALVAQGFL